MSEVRKPEVMWTVGDGESRSARRAGRSRMPRSVMQGNGLSIEEGDVHGAGVHAQRRPRQWVVIDPDEDGEGRGAAATWPDEDDAATWTGGDRRWRAVGDGAAVRQMAESVDLVAGWRWAFAFIPVVVFDAVVSFIISVVVVIGSAWPYYVLAVALLLIALAANVGFAFMVREPWRGSDLERRIRSVGETPVVLFRVRRLLNSGWGAATGEALWFWNRAHRFLWKRPPSRIHFSAVHGYKVVPRGSRATLLLLVYMVRGTPQVPAVTWDIRRGGRLELLRLNLSKAEVEKVVRVLAQYGVQPLPSLHWPSWWGVPLNRRNVITALVGAGMGEMLFRLLLRGFSPVDIIVSLPMVGLMATGARRLSYGQIMGLVLLVSGTGSLISMTKLYYTDAMMWHLAFLGTLSLAAIPLALDIRRGMTGWVPYFFRLLWVLWLLMDVLILITLSP